MSVGSGSRVEGVIWGLGRDVGYTEEYYRLTRKTLYFYSYSKETVFGSPQRGRELYFWGWNETGCSRTHRTERDEEEV